MMKSLIIAFAVGLIGFCNADTLSTPQPYVGEWNCTYSPQGTKLCMKLKAGIRLDIEYETTNGTKRIATINSTDHVMVNHNTSQCENNATTDSDESLVLDFNKNQKLTLYFTRDRHITKDDNGNKWQLYKVEFDFIYDDTFPDSRDYGKSGSLSNTNASISGIGTGKDMSFSCSRTGSIQVVHGFNITMTSLRVQAYMTGDDFSAADHCAIDQETTDLIPIIIGAALAALVIIVLVAYLIGRARANKPAYDNMQ